MTEVLPFGDRALRFDLPSPVGPSSPVRSSRRLLATLRAVEGVVDVVLTEAAGAVLLAPGASLESVRGRVAAALGSASDAATPATETAPALHTVHVVYDGPDLASVAAALGLAPEEVITRHAAQEYEVAMLGFMPGFAYLRGLDPGLVLPRRAEPRTRVPAGSVAIAAEYTGIYPFASPGGWNLLGEALDPRLLDESTGARFAAGDRVRFVPVTRPAHVMTQASTSRAAAAAPRGAHLDVRKAQGPALVVDGGRIGHMHEGVPHGGALVPEALARANAAAGNDAGAAAFELYGPFAVAARGATFMVADDAGITRVLADGQTFEVATEGRARVRYLAVRGGLDVRVVLGGRGTMLGARMGGLDGRTLRRGDLLGVGAASGRGASSSASAGESDEASDRDAPIEVLLGPDHDAGVERALLATTFTVGAASDRVGTRLEGPALPAHSMQDARDRRSAPMLPGAIEVTPAGLVVLGPDHPTTGGYPVVAVVSSRSLGRLFTRPVGSRVTFAIRAETPT